MRQGDGWTAVALEGIIDERSELGALTESVEADVVVIDPSAVRRINSVGVREWVNWMKALRERGVVIVLIDCSPAMMDQVNLVRNFAEGALVVSFQAPYYCDRCDLEQVHVIDTETLRAAGAKTAPSFTCGKAACVLTFDDVEESYFSFLEDQPSDGRLADYRGIADRARAALSAEAPLSVAAPARAASNAPAAPADPGAAFAPDEPGSRLADLAFVGVLLLLGGLLAVLMYLMLTLE